MDRPGWVYQRKEDGWRMLALKDGARVRLVSRRRPHGPLPRARWRQLPAPTLVLDARGLRLRREPLLAEYRHNPLRITSRPVSENGLTCQGSLVQVHIVHHTSTARVPRRDQNATGVVTHFRRSGGRRVAGRADSTSRTGGRRLGRVPRERQRRTRQAAGVCLGVTTTSIHALKHSV